ncbi:poly-like [Scleropages formosus]|uniref:Poly [ADP-ribose] polymerase n=1 Tax=Scleropages formosus TaxID=113540 RepID=A0A0P7YRW4_SCLFO|nr:poly-like [Scleropages formosus]
MEGYEYPLSVQGNWVPNAAKVKNKLQIYFQSAKKSGGGDCKVEYDENNNTATVWFNSEEDAGQEVARADLNVEDRNKQPPQTKMIVLENVKENMQKEMLGLMLEQIGNLSEDMFSLELITEINKAVISFTNTEDASQFLKDCSSNRRFQQYGLSARPLEQTRSVKVENLPSEISEDFLELMFEREKEGGGPVETIKMIPEEQAAIITFMDPKVVETVQNKKWQIRKTSVNVYPYYGSFEMALYGKDRPKWKMPNPFTQGINYGLWSFLHKKEQIDIIKEHMKNNFCEADFETSIVKLSPLPDLLRKRGLTVKHINDWQNNATEMFQKVLSKYKTFEFHVSSSVWSQTERVIESAVKEDVSLEYDSAKGTLTIAGFTNDVDRLKSVVEGTVQNVTSKIERENNSVSMEMDLEAEVFCILQKEGIQQRAQDKFPELKFDYKPDAKKLVFVGLSNEILSTRNDILETRLQMKKKHVEVDPSLLSFLNAVNNVEMSSQIFTPHNINALYKIHQGVVEIISISEQTLIQAETELKKVLVTQCIDTEDKELLRKPEWLNLEEDLRKTYNTTKITIEIKHVGNGKITICGISNHVKRVYELMSDFINKNTQIEECVPVQLSVLLKFIQDIKSEFWKKGTSGKNVEVAFEFSGPQIKLSGGRLYVQEMKASLLQLTSSLYTDCLRISKPGAREFYLEKEKMISGILMKDCNCMVMLQEKNVAMQEAEDHIVCTSNTESLSNIQDVEPLKTISHDHPEKQKTRDGLEINTKEGLSIILKKGYIQEAISTVIISSISKDLDLSDGGLSKAILQAAGPELQDFVQKQRVNTPAEDGDVVVTDGCQLKCDTVFHTVCPQWDNGTGQSEKILREIVQKCFKLAEKQEAQSISFPAIGTGNLDFPKDLVAKMMLEETLKYSKSCPIHLQEVFYIVHPSDTETVETMKVIVFQTEMIAEFHESMQAREGTALPNAGKQKSWFTSAFDKLTGLFKTPSENEPKARKPDLLTSRPIERNISPTTFQFCAESLQDVTKAKEFLEDLILKEQMQKTIKDRCISQLTLENIRRIKELEEKHRVLIIMHESAPDPYIQLEGLTRDVMSVDGEIRDMIKEIERAESLLREAKIQSSLVQWTYKSEDDHFEAFDALTNLHLEKAFQNKNSHLDLRINNKDYKVNFQTFKAETWGATFDVKRTELKGVNIPSHWDPMNNSETKQIELKTDSNEFQEVKDLFRATSSDFTVKKIERIQNSSLWQNYQIKKRQTDEKNSHSNNERRLFHGTSVDTIQKINAHGFNRSFHGKNADVYGNGTYFAVDAKYSAQGTYSSMDDKGQKYMYLARVIVGNYTRGQKGLREPPPKDPTNPTDLYDSVVDKKDNPSMFVVFHDVQAYPEYLITFCQS